MHPQGGLASYTPNLWVKQRNIGNNLECTRVTHEDVVVSEATCNGDNRNHDNSETAKDLLADLPTLEKQKFISLHPKNFYLKKKIVPPF